MTPQPAPPESGPASAADPAAVQALSGPAAFQALALELLAQARRHVALLLMPPDLAVYGPPECAEALRRQLRPPHPVTVRLLVTPGLTRERSAAALWRLAQDWPSYVEVRCLGTEQLGVAKPLLTVDDRAYLARAPGEELRGRGACDAAAGARALRGEFDALWWHAEPDPECRRLAL